MPAAQKPLYVEQGSTFTTGFYWYRPLLDTAGNPILDANGNPQPGTPYDLTGYTGRIEIRVETGGAVLATLTTENGGIRFGRDLTTPTNPDDPTNGRVDITIGANALDAVTATTAKYDLKVYDGSGGEWRILTGTVTINQATTLDAVP